MKNPNLSIIDQIWPKKELEYVDTCLYCFSKNRILAYKGVKDLSFYSAPGKWNFWECKKCQAIYLSPRPSEKSIHKAYNVYYTHDNTVNSFIKKFKNECYSSWLNVNITPRLNFPKLFGFTLKPFKNVLKVPFELEHLIALRKGRLLDVGCGDGKMLHIAKELGWDVTGLEIDSKAVMAAKKKGLKVIKGDYKKLKQIKGDYNCIICSHVLEHVHNPILLIELITKSLNKQGVLLLSLPNANSHVKKEFGGNWRGLEAPRHISIPTTEKLIAWLNYFGYSDIRQYPTFENTIPESIRIKKRLVALNKIWFIYLKIKCFFYKRPLVSESDFIQIYARKTQTKL